MFDQQHKEEQECIPSRGCVLLSGVKNGTDVRVIKANRMPPSSHNSDYSLCVWLYVKSSNFAPDERTWKTVLYRGGSSTGDQRDTGSDGSDQQFSVQPGVWLNGPTNKMLIRWETLGRVPNIKPCTDPTSVCCKYSDIGNRQMLQDDSIQFCQCTGRKKGKPGCDPVAWSDEPRNLFSMNPLVNAPNPDCTATKAMKAGEACAKGLMDTWLYNTTDANTDNECCVDNIPLDRWFHLGIVVREQSGDVYIDGKLYKTVAFNSLPVVDKKAPLVLCKDSNSGTVNSLLTGYAGAMTQIRYFKSSITPYDILKIYSWGPHPFEIQNPKKILKELEDVGGSIHVTAHASAHYDKQQREDNDDMDNY